ncbi:hypothetical protein DdX_13114 [Ditylenchus destructor]|uniref:Uncharacterized protein n=1 Tax=Ditylenchus destructor TaxID=166010 RepID=A0AAD4MX29_9BILA|nr:hypothetical protein DdX_13114 [Ditylenchus destructor]
MSVADPETGKYCMEMAVDNITGQIQYHNTNCNCLYTLNFTVAPESIITNGTCGNTTFWDYLEVQFVPYSQEIPDLWYMPWFITLRFARHSDGRFSLLNYDLNVFFGEGTNASTARDECGRSFFTPLVLIIVAMIVVLFVVVNIGVYAYIRRSHHNHYTVFLNP